MSCLVLIIFLVGPFIQFVGHVQPLVTVEHSPLPAVVWFSHWVCWAGWVDCVSNLGESCEKYLICVQVEVVKVVSCLVELGGGVLCFVLKKCPSVRFLPQVDLDSWDLLVSCPHPNFPHPS